MDTDKSAAAPLARMSKIVPSLDSLVAASDVKPSNEVTIIVPNARSRSNDSTSSSGSGSTTTRENDNENPNIPDGGWGWVVVFATFVLCMICDGITFSFGLLYVEFLKEFEASNSATSWIGSLFMAVPLLTGPLMSALVDKFGCRLMTMIGGSVSALGFILSSKCYSLSLMYLTFGLLAGLGLGVIYVTVVVSVAFWFEKKRTLAVGISSSGIGIGTFVFSPITSFLTSQFGWRGTTMILGGFFLNMCVCGALMRDPEWIEEDQNSQNTKSKNGKLDKSKKTNSSHGSRRSTTINTDELRALLTRKDDAQVFLSNLATSLENNDDRNKLTNYFASAVNLPTYIREHETVPVEVLELLRNNKNVYNLILNHYPSLLLKRSASEDVDHPQNEIVKSVSVHQDLCNKDKSSPQQPLMKRKNSGHEKYFKNLKVDKHSMIPKGALFNTNKYRLKASSCPNIYRVSLVSIPKERKEKWYSEIVDVIKDMFDYSLFTELHFFLFSLSTITLFTWFIVPYFYLADLMSKHGYTNEQASFTISNIGISNTIGMIILGWAGDRSWMDITKTCAVCIVVCGLSVAGQMLFIDNFIMLQICASLFGISLAAHFVLTPGIVLELVNIDRFTIAYGLQLLCQGIGTLVGPPYAGLLYDMTQKWEQSFYQAAIWIVLSGLFVGLVPYIRNRKLIGKGSLEKFYEKSRTQLLPLVFVCVLMLLSFALVFYLTTVGIQAYLNDVKLK